MSGQLLFLLGGSAAFEAVAEAFISAAGGSNSKVALLMQGGPNWQTYVPEYTEPWTRRGVTRYSTVVPGESGELDLDAVTSRLSEATGIFTGGATHRPTTDCMQPSRSVR